MPFIVFSLKGTSWRIDEGGIILSILDEQFILKSTDFVSNYRRKKYSLQAASGYTLVQQLLLYSSQKLIVIRKQITEVFRNVQMI